MLPQPDGKVVMTDEESSTVVRLNTDGSLDRSFGGDGVVTDIMDVSVGAAALQPDGKLVSSGRDESGSLPDAFQRAHEGARPGHARIVSASRCATWM